MKAVTTLSFLPLLLLCIGSSSGFVSPEGHSRTITTNHAVKAPLVAPLLSLSSTTADEQESLARGYFRTKTLNVLNSAMLLTMTSDIAQFPVISGCILAAGVSHMLATAAENARLRSETYKRLNLALLTFYGLSLVGIPGGLSYFKEIPKSAFYVVGAAFGHAYGAVLAYKGWRMGFDGSDDAVGEVKKGIKSTFSSLFPTKGRGWVYTPLLVAFSVGIVHNLGAVIKSALATNTVAFSKYLVGLGRLVLLSTMMFSLKNAAERDRLTGITFIQMNYLTALWFVLTGMCQSAQPGIKFLAPTRAMFPAATAFVTLGFVTTQERNDKKKLEENVYDNPPKALEVIDVEEED